MSLPVDSIIAGYMGVLLAAVVGETVVSLRWNRAYFRSGIPIFKYVARGAMGLPPGSGDQIERTIPASRYVPIEVRRIEEGVFGVREAGWGGLETLSYTAVMRGRLVYRADGSVELTGMLTWWVILFVAGWFGFLLMGGFPIGFTLLFSFVLLGLLGWIFRLQSRRFAEVAQAAVQVRA